MPKDMTFTICACVDGTETERDLGAGITGVWGVRCCDEPSALPVGDTSAAESGERCLCALRFDSADWELSSAAKWMTDNAWVVRDLQFSGEAGAYVTRDADLFEAGDYPDRKMTVSEADLSRLASTPGEIPIQVEHAGGPIKLGFVDGLSAAGKWLRGRLNFIPEASALLDKLGVRGVSVSVPRDLSRVLEVSVTGSPRVAGAAFYSAGRVQLRETVPVTGGEAD